MEGLIILIFQYSLNEMKKQDIQISWKTAQNRTANTKILKRRHLVMLTKNRRGSVAEEEHAAGEDGQERESQRALYNLST